MSLPTCASPGLRLARAGLWPAVVIMLIATQMAMHRHDGADALDVDSRRVAAAGQAAVAEHVGRAYGADDGHGSGDDHGGGGHEDASPRWMAAISSGAQLVLAAGMALLGAAVSAMVGTMGTSALAVLGDRYARGAPRGPTAAGRRLLLSVSMLRI